MKKGLVLEGGGLRSLFTSGILDVMLEHDITFDGLIGVSAGAIFGCNYKSKQIGRGLRYNIALMNTPNYMGLKTFIKTGNIVNADFAYHVVPFEIDVFDGETFKKNPIDFWMVMTDIETGESVYHQMKEFTHEELEWMRASASMPLVSKPVEIDGRKMLDGGMTNSIPLEAFQQMGYERNVVILTQPQSYYKKPSRINWLFKVFCRKYPKIAEIMKRRYIMYNSQLDFIHKEEQKGNTLLIYPEEPLNIGRTEMNEEKMRRVYDMGREKGEQMLQQIKDFLEK